MERYLCVHCHFYQPPRENPWLEEIEYQDSAYPFHDWNQRITAECYAPNTASRILDRESYIEKIVNNYATISFNFGPTLLSWMEEKRRRVYQCILDADRVSAERFSGHGSAIAQAYNHMILPLANRRDRETQVLWGVRDFQRRFGRDPEGMWLPETACDVETLEILAGAGIAFTILAPHQAARMRNLGARTWRDVSGSRIDPTQPYRVRLSGGRSIVVFFYDGPISRAVAFEGLLRDGEQFAQRLVSGFSDSRSGPQLMHIATDGETYGHHHRHGDMALAYALDHIESRGLARLTNYGEYLALHPPSQEAEIINGTSWSCAHGIERWRSDCGCNTGGHAEWRQHWREPLRNALDFLRDEMTPRYEREAAKFLCDPWRARDEYIDVILDRSTENVEAFLQRHARRQLSSAEVVLVLKLLELQRHAMLMYTSCGWFFDELSGIETVQVIMYAGRAIQLAQEVFGDHLEQRLLERLAAAKSNLPEQGDGARLYERYVRPAMVDLPKVGAHYAISSMFERYGERDSIYCYDVARQEYRVAQSGRASLAVGRAVVQSRITHEAATLSFGVLHLGDHNLNAGVREFRSQDLFHALVDDVTAAFDRADLPEVIRLLDRHFEGITYSLKSLFTDEQRLVVNQILKSVRAEAEASYSMIYDRHAALMRFLTEIDMPLPPVFRITAEFVLNANLRHAFEEEDPELERVQALLESAARDQVKLDGPGLAYALSRNLERQMVNLVGQPDSFLVLERLNRLVQLAVTLPFEVNLWRVQNIYWELLHDVYPQYLARTDEQARRWVESFQSLAGNLRVRIPQNVPVPQVA